MRPFAFAGRTCVLTGAASGIGAALALDLARRRTVLALIDKDAAGLDRVAATGPGGRRAGGHHVRRRSGRSAATGWTWPPRSPPATAGSIC